MSSFLHDLAVSLEAGDADAAHRLLMAEGKPPMSSFIRANGFVVYFKDQLEPPLFVAAPGAIE